MYIGKGKAKIRNLFPFPYRAGPANPPHHPLTIYLRVAAANWQSPLSRRPHPPNRSCAALLQLLPCGRVIPGCTMMTRPAQTVAAANHSRATLVHLLESLGHSRAGPAIACQAAAAAGALGPRSITAPRNRTEQGTERPPSCCLPRLPCVTLVAAPLA